MTRRSALLATAMLYLHALPAEAQVSGENETADGVSGGGLAEPDREVDSGESDPNLIVVTARRRAENLQRVPVAVQAVTGEEFSSRGLSDVLDIQYAAPSLTFAQGPTVNSSGFSIRGVGTVGFSPSVEHTIGLTIDGIPQGARGAGITTLLDVAQIEVLRGPQGTLFGKNASAGLVTITSNAPDLDERLLRLRAGYGSYDETTGEAVVNVPVVTDRVGLRVAGRYNYRGSFQTNLTNGDEIGDSDEWFVRGRARFEATDRLMIDLIGETSRYEADCCIAALRDVDLTNMFIQAAIAAGVEPGPNNDDVAITEGLPSIVNTNDGLTLEVNYELGPAVLTALVGHREFSNVQYTDVDYSPIPASRNRQTNTINAETQELRLTSREPLFGIFDYVAGLFHYDAEIFREQLNTGRPDTRTHDLVGNDSTAVFGQVDVHPTEQLTFVLGGRYTWDTVSQNSFVAVPSDVPLVFATGGIAEEQAFTYRAAAQYQFTPTIMAFASIATGYKGPAFSAIPAVGFQPVEVVEPETSTEYSVGLRSQFLNRTLTVNLTAFQQDFENFQAVVFNAAQFVNVLQNAGSARARGIEWEIAYRPTDEWTFTLDGAYVDAEFTDFQNVPCTRIYLTRIPEDCPGGLIDATGEALPNAPKFTNNLLVRYERPVSADLTFHLQGTYSYRSKVNFKPTGDPFYEQEGYGLLGFSLSLGRWDERWRVSLFGTNILDKRYSVGIVEPPGSIAASTTRAVGFEARRRIGASVAFEF